MTLMILKTRKKNDFFLSLLWNAFFNIYLCFGKVIGSLCGVFDRFVEANKLTETAVHT